ncbi:MAG: CRTAC1 family protein [Candidatus Cloacimonetes bacterium]|nr:CRTAC1 family protein [Candidatus Cloacimonadota bacterium]
MRLQILFIFIIHVVLSITFISAISIDDVEFCYYRELWQLLNRYEPEIRELAINDPQNSLLYDVLEDMAIAKQDTLAFINILEQRVINLQDFNDAFRLLKFLKEKYTLSTVALIEKRSLIEEIFDSTGDKNLIKWAMGDIEEEELYHEMSQLPSYPQFFDNYIQSFVNEIAVERSDSLRVNLSEDFYRKFPASRWQDTNIYYLLISLLNLEKYTDAIELIDSQNDYSPALSFLVSGILTDSNLRKSFHNGADNQELLDKALFITENAAFPFDTQTISVLYQKWDDRQWENKRALQKARIIYHQLISEYHYWGDEDLIAGILEQPYELYQTGLDLLHFINPLNNDFGEIAEHKYWLGRYSVLFDDETKLGKTAEYFIDCLIASAPRKRFDESALKYLKYLHERSGTKDDLMTWSRKIKNYRGPIFSDVTEESGFSDLRFTRISIGDYNNDGKTDLLFNGRRLYRNDGNFDFTDVTEEAGIVNHSFVGGLWADFDKDGLLDFVALSSSRENPGDTLFRNIGDGSFQMLDSPEYRINNHSPTEGAAWVDFEKNGYPSLYTANYEMWQVQPGFRDFFWYNDQGRFIDQTAQLGFLAPEYTDDPGLAGRGVSPADYNNDGIQSIFVSNYRLNRNYLWDYSNGVFKDHAALKGVAGHKYRIPDHLGYYGHTIGADWGDYNNNGYLDLFIANLAHPRFIEFSDISMLLRNDGLAARVIGDTAIVYHNFTDVTKEAGITFDELHSDPNWFDADNDGFLDLYITSVYENDRSYLYLNNLDGTFTDITWLSGTRVYNGWGNSVADLNGNGRLDLIVGSGNGVRKFRNDTDNEHTSVFFKPYWDGEEVKIIEREDWHSSIPNSPAFGIKVQVKIELPDGSQKTLIRELNGGKGTTSQNDQFLHFGLGEGTLLEAKIWQASQQQ